MTDEAQSASVDSLDHQISSEDKRMKKVLALTALLALFPLGAQAIPITGSFGFIGTFSPLGGTTAATARGLDFGGPTGRIGTCSGAYTSIFTSCNAITGDIVTLTDVADNTLPDAGGLALVVNSFLTSSTLDFDITSITAILRDATSLLTALTISGTGTSCTTVAGFDCTDGNFIFTFNGAREGEFTFSSSVRTEGRAVPEPGALALVTLGLLGMAVARRRSQFA